MKAMLLAAGRGKRMRPLTDLVPKPLLAAGGHALIEYHLHGLASAGYREAIVNLSWQGARIRELLGDGTRYGLSIRYSDEGEVALETGGGIRHALSMLGAAPFLLINADVWTDYDFSAPQLPAGGLAQLLMVDNPPHHPRGDYALAADGRLVDEGERLTYAGIGVYHPALFAGDRPERFPLKPLLDEALAAGRLSGRRHTGAWHDVGTPARLVELDEALRAGRLQHPVLRPRVS